MSDNVDVKIVIQDDTQTARPSSGASHYETSSASSTSQRYESRPAGTDREYQSRRADERQEAIRKGYRLQLESQDLDKEARERWVGEERRAEALKRVRSRRRTQEQPDVEIRKSRDDQLDDSVREQIDRDKWSRDRASRLHQIDPKRYQSPDPEPEKPWWQHFANRATNWAGRRAGINPNDVQAIQKAATSVAGGAGEVATAGGGAVTSAAGGAAVSGAAAAGVAAAGIAALAAAAYAGTKAVTALTETMLERSKELAKFSPQIAGAEARQSIREVVTDLREAMELGNQYAGLTDVWGELRMELRELLLPIKKFILTTLAEFLKSVLGYVELLKSGSPLAAAAMGGVAQIAQSAGAMEVMAGALLGGVNVLVANAQQGDKSKLPDLFKQIFDANNSMPNYRRNDPIASAGAQSLNIPAFAGI